jgi:hypothetical protein
MSTALVVFYAIWFVMQVAVFFVAVDVLKKIHSRELSWTELIVLAASMPVGGFTILLLSNTLGPEEND